MKRVLSVLLSALMILSILPAGVLTASATDLIDINECLVELSQTEAVYSGEVFAPVVESVTYGEDTVLEAEIDYTVAYENSASADVGTYKITLTGIGAYTSEKVVEYSVVAQNLEEIKDRFSLSESAFIYDGSEHKPTVFFDGAELGEEFMVAYDEDTISVGDKKVIVTATENTNYTGSVQLDYTVAKKLLQEIEDRFSLSVSSLTYDGQEHRPAVLYNGEILPEEFAVEYDEDIVNAGMKTVTVSATEDSEYSGSITLSYTIAPLDITDIYTVVLAEAEYVYNGKEYKPEITVVNGEEIFSDENYDVEYENNINAGVATVKAVAKGNYTGTVTGDFTIAQKEIAEDWLNLSANEVEYTGKEIKPVFVITDSEIGYELVEGTDFILSCTDSLNVGTANATVEAKGNYSGQIEFSFEITESAFTADDVVLSATVFEYTGENQKPELSITVGDLVLNNETDYVVSWPEESVNAGVYTLTVSGIGNYSCQFDLYYSITQKEIGENWIEEIAPLTYTGEELIPDVVVKDGEKVLEKDTDYIVEYQNNKDAGSATAIITAMGNYNGSVSVNFEIQPKEIADFTINGEYTFTGSEILPEIEVKDDEILLIKDVDYTVGLADNINAGKATVTVTMQGNYTGTVEKQFDINAKDISELNIALSQVVYEYDRTAHCPDVEPVMYGEIALEENVDYVVEKDTATKNIGTYDVKITALSSNYTGEVILHYSITRAQIFESSFALLNGETALEEAPFVYDTSEHRPTITFEGNEIYNAQGEVQGSGFIVTFSDDDFVSAGKKTVTIVAQSPYTGTVEFEYEVLAQDINGYISENEIVIDYTINGAPLDEAELIYNGKPYEPEVGEISGLEKDTDYEITISNNTNAGEASVTVTGKGNYQGSVVKTFNIIPYTISDENVTVTLSKTEFNYNGTGIEPTISSVVMEGFDLIYGIDYDVTYADNKDVTTDTQKAKVIVNGINNFVGTASAEFSIHITSFSNIDSSKVGFVPIENCSYDGAPKEPKAYIEGLEEGVDFDVFYWNNTNAGIAQIMLRGKGGYTGMFIFGFAIAPQVITDDVVEVNSSNCIYNAKPVVPDVKIEINGLELLENRDYTVNCIRNTQAGTATVAITGVGNYYGTLVKDYTVSKRKLTKSMFTVSETVDYTGSEVEPSISAKNCTANDYTITCENNVSYGIATVTIKGKNNCRGSVSFDYVIIPARASGSATSTSYNSVKVSWTKQKGVSGYVVYRSTNNKTFTRIATLKGSSVTSYTDSGLTSGVTYYYKLRAYKKIEGKNYYGKYSKVFSMIPRPNQVAQVGAVTTDYTSAQISWEKQAGVTGYELFRSTDNETFSLIKTATGSSNITYVDESLTPGKTYYYKLRAYKNSNGSKVYGEYSEIVNVKQIPKTAAISKVTNLSGKKAQVKWSKISGVTGYEVYRSTNKKNWTKVVKLKGSGKVSYTDSSLSKSKTYYYRVRAYKVINGKTIYGEYSSVKSVKITK